MAEERTHLELSEDEGTAHKFYEVVVDGTELRIRFGRIGDKGQQQAKSFPTFNSPKTYAKRVSDTWWKLSGNRLEADSTAPLVISKNWSDHLEAY